MIALQIFQTQKGVNCLRPHQKRTLLFDSTKSGFTENRHDTMPVSTQTDTILLFTYEPTTMGRLRAGPIDWSPICKPQRWVNYMHPNTKSLSVYRWICLLSYVHRHKLHAYLHRSNSYSLGSFLSPNMLQM